MDQVRGIADELSKKRVGLSSATVEDAATVNQAAATDASATHQKAQSAIEDGGIHTNDKTTVKQYFNYYAKLANQQNMLEDSVRTPKYREAIVGNPSNFAGKVVMDVGCGSGILSLFAA